MGFEHPTQVWSSPSSTEACSANDGAIGSDANGSFGLYAG